MANELAELAKNLKEFMQDLLQSVPGTRIRKIEADYKDFRLGTSCMELRPRILVEFEDVTENAGTPESEVSRDWKYPLCEVCGKKPAVSFTALSSGSRVDWKFTCHCTRDYETYYVMLDEYFKDGDSILEWLYHLMGKEWFSFGNFNEMLSRFAAGVREANNV